MNQPIVVIGVGELGGVFAKGLLRLGHPVYPIARGMNIANAAKSFPKPVCVLVAVAEKDLPNVLAKIPIQWIDRLALLQNELLPSHWEAYRVEHPTVVIVWFEKKRGQACKILLPSRIYGPNAGLFADAMQRLDIPCKVLASEADMLFELALKNTFILTINIAGLEAGGTTGSLWTEHNRLARRVAHDVIDLQELSVGGTLPRDRLISALEKATCENPDHKCVGRSAKERLARNVEIADNAGLEISTIREISRRLS